MSLLVLAASSTAAQQPAAGNFDVVVEAVEKYFDTQADYEHGDLITRSQITQILAEVADAGVKIEDAGRVIEMGLPDNSFLARELSTAAGRKFMRSVARNQGGFDRLDRLSRLPRGQQLVRDLIRQPGGERLIEYLVTTKGGRNMGAMVGGARAGGDLNTPTGRIYTSYDLVAELQRQHVGKRPVTKEP